MPSKYRIVEQPQTSPGCCTFSGRSSDPDGFVDLKRSIPDRGDMYMSVAILKELAELIGYAPKDEMIGEVKEQLSQLTAKLQEVENAFELFGPIDDFPNVIGLFANIMEDAKSLVADVKRVKVAVGKFSDRIDQLDRHNDEGTRASAEQDSGEGPSDSSDA